MNFDLNMCKCRDLSHNQNLRGTIPSSIGMLKQLHTL